MIKPADLDLHCPEDKKSYAHITFYFCPAVLPRKYCTLCTLIILLMEPSGSGSFCLQYRPQNYIKIRSDVVIS